MINIINEKYVITRKKHKCFGCLSIIDKNNKVFCGKYSNDGIAYNLYFCKNCKDHQSKYCKNCNDCFDEYGSSEGYISECDKYDII